MNSAPVINKVAVVGGGLMGTGIAESTASAGLPVIIRDVDETAIEHARARLETSLARGVRTRKMDNEAADEIRALVEFTIEMHALTDADLVIEAVPEQRDLKLAVMSAIDGAIPEHTIVASNTSSIPITELAQPMRNPERVLGLHFFSPVPAMSLVEIVVGLDTDERTVSAARAYSERIGKSVIETKDRSGFIVNRLLVPYLMSAVRMFEEGFATREDIDTGMKLGCGHPVGPLTLCDLVGLDVLEAVCDSLYEEFKRDVFAPPPLLKRMVASGRLGRKSGRGFYSYS